MNPVQIVKLPISLLQVASSAKSFADNPVLGCRWLNERGLHRHRCAVAARMADWRRRHLADTLAPPDRKTLDEAGFLVKQDFLPIETFHRLREEITGQVWPTMEMRQRPTLTRRSLLNPGTLQSRAPTLARLLQDREIRNLIRYASASGGQPFYALQAIATRGVGGGDDPQTLPHADTFHATAKAWFFLHDVSPEDGPFFYVPGSHRKTSRRLDWEYRQSLTAAGHPIAYHRRGSFRATETDLTDLGFGTPVLISVPGNTLVVADTSGFHGRAPSPRPTTRLEVYASLRRNPFLPWLGWHLMALPVIRQMPGSLAVLAALAFDGMGVRRPWCYRGMMALDAPLDAEGLSESS